MMTILLSLFVLLFPYLIFRTPPKPKRGEIYDFILVLGCPTNADHTLSQPQKKRIDAAIYYVKEKVADTIIVSGADVQHGDVEADIIGDILSKKLPEVTIKKECKARNTYQNLKFTKALFGGNRILVISSPSHLRRAYFFTKKFYPHACMGCADFHDPLSYYIWEYTRMWVALYWEIRLALFKK